MALLVALSAIWISLLQILVIPKSYTWLVSFPLVLLIVLFTCTCFRSLTYCCYWAAAYWYFSLSAASLLYYNARLLWPIYGWNWSDAISNLPTRGNPVATVPNGTMEGKLSS
ncbi:protein of unknown function-containing protein [Forsythia ovata]|uniref:Uncharacterized protein n=1 Tax=Forsythia ovata TaxID=205694 RepID=A0ABD1T5S8_9LAMI